MNHFQLFLNASTQMIFIVYASLSVLRVFHVSTFSKGWQEQPGQSRRQVHLAPCPPRRAPHGRKRLALLLLRWASEQRHRDPQGLSPTPADDPLQVLLLLRWCLDPANFYTVVGQRLPLSWRAYAVNMRPFHWVHWGISDADYLHVPRRCTFTSKHAHLYIYGPVVFRILRLLCYRERWSEAEGEWSLPSPTIISYSSHPWLRCCFQRGIPFSFLCTFLLSVTGFFFFWLWEDTTKVEYIGHKGRIFMYFNAFLLQFRNLLIIWPVFYRQLCRPFSKGIASRLVLKIAMYGMLTILPALEDHPLAFFKEAWAGYLFF